MNQETKTLLKLSITEFKAAPAPERAGMLKHIENHLVNPKYYAAHYVQAGRIFLRLFKPRKLFTLKAYGYKAEAVKQYTGSNYNVFISVYKGRKLLHGYSEKHTTPQAEIIKQLISWMRESRRAGTASTIEFINL